MRVYAGKVVMARNCLLSNGQLLRSKSDDPSLPKKGQTAKLAFAEQSDDPSLPKKGQTAKLAFAEQSDDPSLPKKGQTAKLAFAEQK
ncbi:hypothetical protein CLNEO_27150 [Anaerotignum neopropionicum]|uniref:Uncharacterized protein n=2 Tax=Anaerotignum neopropionicum TaxID=36847 RepID=A0A136WBI6_9FIRM|nr:hypothetical protein CLNEO_27150 [Anaerotignum neopropionicum]